jgi:WD40 repeat protein
MGPARRFFTTLGLFLAAGLFSSDASAFPKIPAFDRLGDPLPPGAVARLGAVKLQAGCQFLHSSADGRTLVGVDGRLIRIWDTVDGRLIDTRRIPGPEAPYVALSIDGGTLARAAGPTVELWDLILDKRLDLSLPKDRKQIEQLAVSNDRRWLLFTQHSNRVVQLGRWVAVEKDLFLWDTVSAEARPLGLRVGTVRLGFSPDGSRAFASGGSWVRVWDTASGKRLWEIPDYNAEECHFTPDGKHLIAAPGYGRHFWRVWEVASGKPSKTLRPPAVGHVQSFAVSPDGNQLLLPTETDYVLWDLKAGEVRHRWPEANGNGRGAFAPDGRSVVTYDKILRRWDLATGKNLYADRSGLGHTAPVRRLFFSPDGTRLFSIGDDRTARVWDVSTTKPLRSIQIEASRIDAWAVTPDGGTLVGVDEFLDIHRWPLNADGPRSTVSLRDAQRVDGNLKAHDVRVGPDGTLALLARPAGTTDARRYSFSFWDLAAGRLIRWGGDPGDAFRDEARLSGDGRLAATPEAVFDTRTGAGHSVTGGPFGDLGAPEFSPDGRLLTAGGRRVWEVATGRAVADLPRGPDNPGWCAFSPDGRSLARVGADRLTVWDLGSGIAVAEWPTPAISGGVAFSPDGRTVATGLSDGTVLLWRVQASVADGHWSAAIGDALWDDLLLETPITAWPAVWELAEYWSEAVRLLRGKYPPARGATPGEVPKLITGLDSAKFSEREAASKRLAELSRAAERPLRAALQAKPSPEQAKRIESLLARLDLTTPPPGEDLRAVRAVAVLEVCGTADARQLLAEWAERGPPRLSDEAARAVERLKWKPVRP